MKTSSSRDRALHRVLSEIHDGLRHGHFEFVLTCDIVGEERRRLILKAGKSYQFLIAKAECDRTSDLTPDSRDGATVTRPDRRIRAAHRHMEDPARQHPAVDATDGIPLEPADLDRLTRFFKILLLWDTRRHTIGASPLTPQGADRDDDREGLD